MSEKNQQMDKNELRKKFKNAIVSFTDDCIPLSMTDNIVYFMSKTNQLYGLDLSKQLLFEPNYSNKYKIIDSYIEAYFNDEVKKTFETKTGIKFDDLVELLLKFNYREKNIGKKFFYSTKERTIFVWSMITQKWETGDSDLEYLFSNSNIIKETLEKSSSSGSSSRTDTAKITTKHSLEDLGANIDDMDEVPKRFRDASIHYYNKKDDKIYSLNILSGNWYVPVETVQKQILVHVDRSAYVAKSKKTQDSSTDKSKKVTVNVNKSNNVSSTL